MQQAPAILSVLLTGPSSQLGCFPVTFGSLLSHRHLELAALQTRAPWMPPVRAGGRGASRFCFSVLLIWGFSVSRGGWQQVAGTLPSQEPACPASASGAVRCLGTAGGVAGDRRWGRSGHKGHHTGSTCPTCRGCLRGSWAGAGTVWQGGAGTGMAGRGAARLAGRGGAGRGLPQGVLRRRSLAIGLQLRCGERQGTQG